MLNQEFFRERWWDDGTVLAGGREYTALSAAACFKRGELSCLNCHSMHHSDPVDQLKSGMEGFGSCITCHKLAKYTTEVQKHTFHAPQSSGSDCLNCHMPFTTYALLKGIRSHQIASPKVEPSARYGTPNACNLCHLDRPLAWTQKHLGERYQQRPVDLTDEQQNVSAALLWLLKGNAAQRVITAWHFGWKPAQIASGTNWLAPFLSYLLADPYGVVRYVAAQAFDQLPGGKPPGFDFLEAEPALESQAAEVLAKWETNNPPPHPRGSAVLLDEKGALMKQRIQKLLRERDNRPVSIKE
jgi:hypothetical protein